MSETFDLQKHIETGVERIVADTIKATLKNPRESAFMARFAAARRPNAGPSWSRRASTCPAS